MDTLYIVMPAYNEEANIKTVVEQWYPILDDKDDKSKLVIADSGSTDGTHDILIKLKEKYAKLDILSDTGKYHGPKLMSLYDYAIKNNANYVFQTDSDGQTTPEEFEMFWSKRQEFDGIFGYRVIRGDGKVRAFVEKVVCILLNVYFGVKVPDANAPFRLMNTEVLKKYLYKMEEDYNLPNIMITTFYSFYNEKTKFIEISFKPRIAGKNSNNLGKIIKIGWKALGDFARFKKMMKI